MTEAGADRLLSDLDALPYPRRMRELAARARLSAARGELRDLLEDLAGHGVHGRRLAAAAAAAGGDKGYLAGHLTDPDPVARRYALRAATRLDIGDYALEVALEDAPAAVRRELLATIVTGRRTTLADQLIDRHRAAWGDAEAARLLPGCGPETVARLLPELFPALRTWHAMLRRHPDALLDEAERQLAALPDASHGMWWDRHAPGMALAADRRPARVLDLLERHTFGWLPRPLWERLNRLAAADPGRTLRLLLSDPYRVNQLAHSGLPRKLLRRLVHHQLPSLTSLAALGRAWAEDPARLAQLVRAVPPSRRAELLESVATDPGTGADGERPERPVDDRILALLPHARRHAEARRLAHRAREQRRPRLVELSALVHLPPAEVRAELLAATHDSNADDRAAAWRLFARNAALSADPRAVTAALDDAATRLRNEQERVRHAALEALTGVHPGLFTEEAADHLDRLAADAIAARDSSAPLRAALGRLADAVLREHAATAHRDLVGWALRTVVRLCGNAGGADLGRLDRTLRRGQEHQVFEALRPWLEAGAEKVDHGLTFALARAVGRRAARMPELQELLRQAVRFGDDATVREAVPLWLADPASRDERVAEVLALDPSAAVLPEVLRLLTLRRTDLLDVVLDDTPPYGRFLSEPARWLPPLDGAVARWLPRQRRAAARLYAREAADAAARPHRRAAAVAALARVPEAEAAEDLRRWAGSPDVALAEAALVALARTDRPGEHLPGLLAHASDDRARVAMHAAGRAAAHVPPSALAPRLGALLLPAPQAPESERQDTVKVTSRKAAVRLAARLLPVPDAAVLLAEVYHHPGRHEDVRAACVASALRLLDDEQGWRIVTHAASHPGPESVELRHPVLRVDPLDLPERHRTRYARLIVALTGTAGVRIASEAYGQLPDWAPWAPEVTTVLARAVTGGDDGRPWDSAAHALMNMAVTTPADPAVRATLLAVLDHLAALDAREDTPDAQADADRPARRRVHVLARRLARAAHGNPEQLRTLAAEAGEVLARHADFVPDAAEALLNAVDLDADPRTLGPALARLAWLHQDRPALAARTARALHGTLAAPPRPGNPATLLAVARELGAQGGAATGQFAVQLARAGGARAGWTPPWRDLVRWLRRHPVPDVRDAALALRTDRA
ncbi:hypothetical protein [Streptomyces sp. 6N223]|uniref:hypothetical protein n=1 Tax=Streptomyces sp. 6N223 TaxID=3457412 RepID=UPI003FD55B89